MALTESNTFESGSVAPSFDLPDVVIGTNRSLPELKGENGTVIMFICNHCPFVTHINDGLVQLADDYKAKGVAFVAISSNNVETHPEDGPEHMKEAAIALGYPFPYLYDEAQEVAMAYDAACTPDFYIFNSDLKSIYHGQLDDSRPGNGKPVTGNSIREALDSLLLGQVLDKPQKPSMGCSIKWK